MFEWNPAYSVNVRELDAQHQKLFRIAADLHTAIAQAKGKFVIEKTLDRMVQFTRVHFAHEERLMRAAGYPDYESHVAEHEALTGRVMQFQNDLAEGRVARPIEILQFLKEWLLTHTCVSDAKYAPHLANLSD